jgi:hypothetical protein
VAVLLLRLSMVVGLMCACVRRLMPVLMVPVRLLLLQLVLLAMLPHTCGDSKQKQGSPMVILRGL